MRMRFIPAWASIEAIEPVDLVVPEGTPIPTERQRITIPQGRGKLAANVSVQDVEVEYRYAITEHAEVRQGVAWVTVQVAWSGEYA